jgi:hypothetical protein
MQTISEPAAGHAGNFLGALSRIMKFARVLGGTLFFLLLHNPVQALGAIVAGQYSAVLNWNPSPSPAVAGYNVYYGTVSGNYTDKVVAGNVTTITVSGLTAGVTYFFVVTAYDTNGLESGFSNESSFVPGLPTVQIRVAPAGQFVLTVSGPAGQTNQILATQDFEVWTVIGTVILGAGGSLDFTDTNAPSFSERFYRTQAMP